MSANGAKSKSERRINDQSRNTLPKSTQLLWEHGHFVDFTIEVEERRFEVHKVVLAAMSGYFQDLFVMSESGYQKDTVHVTGVSAGIMDVLIHFIYSNKMILSGENIADVLAGAVLLKIPRAIAACTQYLIDNLSVDNWFYARTLSQKYKLVDCEDKVQTFISNQLFEIINSDSLSQLLCSDIQPYYWLWSEWDLFLFINRWINADVVNREEIRDDYLSEVRYCLLTPARLSSITKMEIYQKSNSKWTQLVREAIRYHKLPINMQVLEYDEQSEFRDAPILLLFAEEANDQGGYSYEIFKEGAFEYVECLRAPQGSGKWVVEMVFNNYLIVCMKVNGEDNLTVKPVQQWYIFNPRALEWCKMTNLPRDFYRGSLAQTSCHIFAVGGVASLQDTSNTSSSIDKYDFPTKTWTTVSHLRSAGKDHGACVLNDRLYVSGGMKDDGPPQDTMDCLTLSTIKWDNKASMLKPRCEHILHKLKIKGEDVLCILDDMYMLECYNPMTNQWSKCVFTYELSYCCQLPHKSELKESTICDNNRIYLLNKDTEEIFDEGYFVLDFPEGYEADTLQAEAIYYSNRGERVGNATNFHPAFISTSPLVDQLDSA